MSARLLSGFSLSLRIDQAKESEFVQDACIAHQKYRVVHVFGANGIFILFGQIGISNLRYALSQIG